MDMMENSKISCRRELWQGTIRREEMCEVVVPDTYPDVDRLIDKSALVLIRGKDAVDGSVTVDCALSCTVLFAGEDNCIFRIVAELPFSMQAQIPGAGSETDITAIPRLEELELRLLNPRKLLIKAELSCALRCYEPGEVIVSSAITAENVHVLEKQIAVSPVVDVREKTFVITDELALPPSGEYSRILSHTAELMVADVKFVGSRMVFKGEARLDILAEADETPVFITRTTPFSQIIDLGCEADRATVELCLTGSRAELSRDEQGRAMADIQLSMLAQSRAEISRELSYVADAYSNAMDCKLSLDEIQLPVGVQSTVLHHEHRCKMDTPTPIREIVAARARCAGAAAQDSGFRAKLIVSCIYLDDAGMLRSMEQSEYVSIEADERELFCAYVSCAEVYAMATAEGAELRVSLELSAYSCKAESVVMVTDIELTEREQYRRRPSLYVVPNRGESTWELAKKYSSTVELIESGNTEPGNIILIPVCQS